MCFIIDFFSRVEHKRMNAHIGQLDLLEYAEDSVCTVYIQVIVTTSDCNDTHQNCVYASGRKTIDERNSGQP